MEVAEASLQTVIEHAERVEAADGPSAALALWHQAAEADPHRADIQARFGDALRDARRLDEAVDAYERATRLAPHSAESWCNLGALQRLTGQTDAAINSLLRAAALQPQLAAAHNNLALAWIDRGEARLALASCETALQLNGQSANTHRSAGRALMMIGEVALAEHHWSIACGLDPRSAAAAVEHGDVLRSCDRLDESLTEYDRAMRLDDGSSDAAAGIARVLRMKGRIGEAVVVARAAHARSPTNTVAAITLAEALIHERAYEDSATVLSSRLGDEHIRPDHRRIMLFMLGDALDKMGRHDQAWHAYEQANRLKQARFDRASFLARVRELLATANICMPHQAKAATQLKQSPIIFIAGMPRSGTTLIEQILASHPGVFALGEASIMSRLIGRLPRICDSGVGSYPHCLPKLTQGHIASLQTAALELITKPADAARMVAVEKSTDNFLHLGLIATVFPNARIIQCRRDPLDTCLSCWFHDFTGHHPYAYDLSDLGFYWRAHEEILGRWSKLLTLPTLTVAYEDVVNDLEAAARRMLEFAGLPWSDVCLRFNENTRTVHTSSRDQVRQPIYRTAMGRHRPYADRLGSLQASLADEKRLL